MTSEEPYDLFIIGGGINGAAIARDAAGRGLKVGLAEKGDFGSGTSSASSKLLHGGLRYLELGEYGLVKKALSERGVIFDAAPHLAHPLAFVMPRIPDTRPDWKIRAGLLLYDHLGDRGGLPTSRRIRLRNDRAGRGLAPAMDHAWRYWDGWIDDSRMVIANLRCAAARGAALAQRNGVISARFDGDLWYIELADRSVHSARFIVNAGGPWAEIIARDLLDVADPPQLRLVQGTHIVLKRTTSSSDAIVLQRPDKRIVFMIPFAASYLLVGTTETDVTGDPGAAGPTRDELVYLLTAAGEALAEPPSVNDIVHAFTGVRPLVLQPGKGARETSRDWQLLRHSAVPALSVIGGKITTHRLLAEAVLKAVAPDTAPWTRGVPLPGADFEPQPGEHNRDSFVRWFDAMPGRFHDYDPRIVRRLAYRFGREAEAILTDGIGEAIGPFYEAELRHFVEKEWAQTAEDILWRRTKAAMGVTEPQVAAIRDWLKGFTRP